MRVMALARGVSVAAILGVGLTGFGAAAYGQSSAAPSSPVSALGVLNPVPTLVDSLLGPTDPVLDPTVSLSPPVPVPVPVPVPTTPVPDPSTTPVPDPSTTPVPDPSTTPVPDPSITPPVTIPPTHVPPHTQPAPGPTPAPPVSVGGGPAAPIRPHPHKILGPPAPKRPHPHKSLHPARATHAHPHRSPWPITITVNTVPALPGVHLTVDGHVIVTAANGQAHYTAQHDFTSHALSIVDASVLSANRRYEFNRWAGQRDPKQAFTRTVTALPLRQSYAVTAAFTVQQQVTPQLVEQNRRPVDLSRVSAISVKSDEGQVVRFAPGVAVWLDAMRPAYHHSALSARAATYSVQNVMVRGTNVVDAGRQTFKPSVDSTPRVITQFHDLVITGHDALFKTAAGKQAVVTFPDGTRQTVSLSRTHAATLTNLPRGTYIVALKAGRAVVAANQFVLSKDKTLDVAVISVADLLVLGSAVLLIALAMLAIGRCRRRTRLVRKFRRSLRKGDTITEPGAPVRPSPRPRVLT